MSPARRLCLLALLATFTLSPAAAAAATHGWTPIRRAVTSDCCTPAAIASNARGDVVAVFSDNGGLSVARARAHGGLGARVRILRAADYPSSRVAIDSRGVAIIAFTYDDETDPAYFEGRDAGCCYGVKVVVWRPGRRPTAPRTVFPRGSATTLGAVAATRGHRGVLVAGQPGRASYDNSDALPTFIPVRLDGSLAPRRTVARRGWAPATLQWVRGRAVVGLIRTGVSARSDLAIARQARRSDAFGAVRRFGRLGSAPVDYSTTGPRLVADGRGGHVALWARSSSTGRQLFLGRATLNGPLRARLIRRDIQGQLRFSEPGVASDGWIVVAWGQSEIGSRAGYVTTRSPRGRLVTSEIRGVSVSDGYDGYIAPFYGPIAAAAPGGRGAVGMERGSSIAAGMRIVGLRAGRPLASAVLDIRHAEAYGTVLTANRRDRARVVFGRTDISPGRVIRLVLESRLR